MAKLKVKSYARVLIEQQSTVPADYEVRSKVSMMMVVCEVVWKESWSAHEGAAAAMKDA